MKSTHPIRSIATRTVLSLAVLTAFASCASNEEFQDRMDKRNESYSKLQERRGMRLDARQERTDAWFDRAMH